MADCWGLEVAEGSAVVVEAVLRGCLVAGFDSIRLWQAADSRSVPAAWETDDALLPLRIPGQPLDCAKS